MAFSVTCPGCASVYPVAEALAGKTIKCKKCGELMTVGAAKAAPAKAVAAAKPAARRPADDEDDAPVRRPSRRRDEDDEDDAPRGKKKGGLPVPLIAGVGGLLLLGGAAGGFFLLSGKDDKPAPGDAGTPVAAVQPVAAPTTPTAKPEPAKSDAPKADAPRAAAAKAQPAGAEATKADTPKEDGPKAGQPKEDAARQGGVPSDTPAAGGASGGGTMSRQEYMAGRMNRLTLDRVKRASVMFRVEGEGGRGEGSGWFGMEPGLVFTNAHVIDMLAPNAKPPKKITMFLNAGTEEQREIPNAKIKILAVDPDLDLAILQVLNEPNLPLPLQVSPSAELVEGQGLNTIGYPFGTRAGLSGKPPEVSVRPSTFTAFRKDFLGRTRRIQIEGGVYTGNSGGPIVDAEGVVRGVVVEVQLDSLSGGQTQLGLGVPTEYVVGLAAGRVAEVEYGVPYRDAGKVKIPVKAKCLDPFNRLKSVGLAAWVGDAPKQDAASAYRRESKDPPKPAANDTDLQEVPLKYDNKTKLATGELVMPEAAVGRVYWGQPFYANQITSKYYLPGQPITTYGSPVDRTPADLVVRIREGAVRSVTMSNSSGFGERSEDEGDRDRVTLKSTLGVKETTIGPDRNDTRQKARLRLQLEDFKLTAEVAGRGLEIENVIPKQIMERVADYLKQAEAIGAVNAQGEMYKYSLNVIGVRDPLTKAIVGGFGSSALEALQGTSVPIPNKRMNAGETWTTVKDGRVVLTRQQQAGEPQGGPPGPGGRSQPRVNTLEFRYREEVKYTYVGQRERGGRREAVVLVEGKVSPAAGTKDNVQGESKGYALIELDTGLVTKADVKKFMEMDTSSNGKRKRFSGGNHYLVTRGTAS